MSKNKHILDKAVLPAPKSNRYFQLLERHPYLCSLLFCLLQFHPVSVPFIFNLSIKAVLPKWTKRRY